MQIRLRQISTEHPTQLQVRRRATQFAIQNHSNLPNALRLRLYLPADTGMGCSAQQEHHSDHRSLHMQPGPAGLHGTADRPDRKCH